MMAEMNRKNICKAMERVTGAPDTEELFQMCWGCLMTASISLAEAGIVALYGKSGRSVTPYRADMLVERLQCDYGSEDRELSDCQSHRT
jgi:hypothetical protein